MDNLMRLDCLIYGISLGQEYGTVMGSTVIVVMLK